MADSGYAEVCFTNQLWQRLWVFFPFPLFLKSMLQFCFACTSFEVSWVLTFLWPTSDNIAILFGQSLRTLRMLLSFLLLSSISHSSPCRANGGLCTRRTVARTNGSTAPCSAQHCLRGPASEGGWPSCRLCKCCNICLVGLLSYTRSLLWSFPDHVF